MALGKKSIKTFYLHYDEIIKTGFYFGTSTFIKLLSGLIIAKIIVVRSGAEGFGLISQFQTILNIFLVFAGGGITTGVTKYVSSYRISDTIKLNSIIQTASFITLVSGLILSFFTIAFSAQISDYLFQTSEYSFVIKITGFFQFFIGFNSFFQAILSGFRETVSIAKISIFGSIFGLICFYVLSLNSSINFLMIGLILFGFFSTFLSLYFIVKKKYHKELLFYPKYYPQNTKLLSKYFLMLTVTVLTLPVAHIAIRNIIESQFGWSYVGKWQGVMKISDAYLQYITIILSFYFFPKLASIKEKSEIKYEILKILKIIVPATILLSGFIFLFRKGIILLLYSVSFMDIEHFFTFQLIGDVFKVIAYTIIMIAPAHGLVSVYIIAEIFQSTLLVFTSYCLISLFGVVGVTYAYALTYFLYMIFAICILILYLKFDFLDNNH
jgi:O-antigen/teichoic acid export membrane protein